MQIQITDTFVKSLKKLSKKRFNIGYSFRSFKQGIKNFIIWFPIIWKDRWWDHTFLYEILYFKLSLMEKGFRKDGNFIGNKKTADEIKLCVLILDRLMENDYSFRAFKTHDEKWGQLEFNFKEDGKLNITRPNVKTEKDEKQERIESEHWRNVEENTIKNDLNLLFKQMEKHIRTWWD